MCPGSRWGYTIRANDARAEAYVAALRDMKAPARTAEAAREHGYDVMLVGEAGGAALAAEVLKLRPKHKRVLYPCGQEARPEAPGVLAHGGLDVDELPVYAMEPLPDFAARVGKSPEPAAVVLGSPKAAEALHAALEAAARVLPKGAALIALGAVTAERATALFGRYVAQSPSTDAAGVAAAVGTALAKAPLP